MIAYEIMVPMIIVIVGMVIAMYFILNKKETHEVPYSKSDSDREIGLLSKIKKLEREMQEMELENNNLATKIKQVQQYQGIENEQVKYLTYNHGVHSNNSSIHTGSGA
jgi:hypothetical protein